MTNKKKNNPIYTGSYSDKQIKKDENIAGISEDEYTLGTHPNSLKNLDNHKFQKGISGNPLGTKPTYKNLKKMLKDLGEEETMNWAGDKNLGTRKSQVYKRIWKMAIDGDAKMIQLLIYLGCLE